MTIQIDEKKPATNIETHHPEMPLFLIDLLFPGD